MKRTTWVPIALMGLLAIFLSTSVVHAQHLLLSGTLSGRVKRYDARTGAFLDNFINDVSSPYGLTYGPDGSLYVANGFEDSISRYDPRTGAFLGYFVPPGSGDLNAPKDIMFGPDNHLYVSTPSLGKMTVKRYDGRTGTYLGDFIIPVPADAPIGGFDFGPDGDLYFALTTFHSVKKYDGRTGAYLGDFVPVASGG